MIEWLDNNVAYWHWVVAGLLLCAAEIVAPSFFMLWLGLSAIAVGIVISLVDMSFAAQITLWVVLSTACLVTWFKFISPRMKDKTLSGMGREAMLGQEGLVIEHNDSSNRGRMRFPAPLLGNDEWHIISNESLKPGDRVRVTDVKCNALSVQKKS